jgi:hypothetical protein
MQNACKVQLKTLKTTDHKKDLGIDGKIIKR